LFDDLYIHPYALRATAFVADLVRVTTNHPDVGRYCSWNQAAFLGGWARG